MRALLGVGRVIKSTWQSIKQLKHGLHRIRLNRDKTINIDSRWVWFGGAREGKDLC